MAKKKTTKKAAKKVAKKATKKLSLFSTRSYSGAVLTNKGKDGGGGHKKK